MDCGLAIAKLHNMLKVSQARTWASRNSQCGQETGKHTSQHHVRSTARGLQEVKCEAEGWGTQRDVDKDRQRQNGQFGYPWKTSCV